MTVRSTSKSTLRATAEESASRWKKPTASLNPFSISMRFENGLSDAVGFAQPVLDQHALRVACDDRRERRGRVVGEEDRRRLMAQITNQELPERAVVALQRHALVDDAGRLELAMRHLEVDGPPGSSGRGRHLGVQRRGPPTERDEDDAQRVELGEVCVGGELGIEDQVARALPVFLFPELDEPQDLVSLLSFSQIGIRVAENLAFRVLREEGEHGLAPLASAGHVVLLDEGVLTEIGDRVKVEVERAGVDKLLRAKCVDPGA